jgi:hypothetical protein
LAIVPIEFFEVSFCVNNLGHCCEL